MRPLSRILSLVLIGCSLAAALVGTILTVQLTSSGLALERTAWMDQLDQSYLSSSSSSSHSKEMSRSNVSLINIDWKQLTEKAKKLKTQEHWELAMANFFNSTPPVDFAFSNDTRFYFIHVGKAGGSSLYEKLGLAGEKESIKRRMVLDCHMKGRKSFDKCLRQFIGESPTRLFRATVGHRHLAATRYHKHKNRWLKNNGTNTLLFTVRDPVARVVSAFNFHYQSLLATGKERGIPFYNCFGSVEDLAQAAGSMAAWNALSPKCRKLGEGFLKGTDKYPGKHMYAGYSYYVGAVWRSDRAVAAVRTEYLAQDMRNLEQRLGGNPKNLGEFQKEARSKSFAINTGLTPEGKHSICCWIVEELPVFENIIMLSQNFGHKEKVAYLRNSRQQCGIQAFATGNDDSDMRAFSWKSWHRDNCPQFVPVKDWFVRLF